MEEGGGIICSVTKNKEVFSFSRSPVYNLNPLTFDTELYYKAINALTPDPKRIGVSILTDHPQVFVGFEEHAIQHALRNKEKSKDSKKVIGVWVAIRKKVKQVLYELEDGTGPLCPACLEHLEPLTNPFILVRFICLPENSKDQNTILVCRISELLHLRGVRNLEKYPSKGYPIID
ncbi:MAG TPA: hypothetical protein VHT73_18975 [Thermodesulfobacteriota bacterium]|nr:hypothetical protein [Thermodesulfobacteriota bacterium]